MANEEQCDPPLGPDFVYVVRRFLMSDAPDVVRYAEAAMSGAAAEDYDRAYARLFKAWCANGVRVT